MRLSKKQQDVYDRMKDGVWASSYCLHVSLSVLYALGKKGLVKSKSGNGAVYSPQTSIQWKKLPIYSLKDLKKRVENLRDCQAQAHGASLRMDKEGERILAEAEKNRKLSYAAKLEIDLILKQKP